MKMFLELAEGLQNSNEESVATLAREYILLYDEYISLQVELDNCYETASYLRYNGGDDEVG